MRHSLRAALALAFLSTAVRSAHAEDAHCAGVAMASAIELDGERLTLNGIGKRTATAFNVDVYVAGLYIPHASKDAASIVHAEPKRLQLQFVRDVSAKEMAEALDDGVKNNVPKDKLSDARRKMKQVTSRLPKLSKGLRLSFTQRPGDVLEVHTHDKLVATIKEPGLAELLFGVWLGEHPPDKDLRQALLHSGSCK